MRHLQYLLLATLLGFAIARGDTLRAQPPKGAAPPPARVFVAQARADTLSEPKSFVGTVKPLRKSIIGSAAPGRVEEYLVNEGDFVKKGTAVAHLRRGIIGAEKRAAEAELEVRKAELAEMLGSLDDEVAQAQAKVAISESSSRYRAAKRDRARQLGPAITRESLEEEESLAVQGEALVRETQAGLRMLTGAAREQKHEQARARVAAQQAEVDRLTEQYERHTMFAPFDGWVTAEFTEVGQWLMQGDHAVELAELGSVDVEIAVLEDYVTKLNQETQGEVEINALGGRRFPGKVAVINPQADLRARTFPVKVRVENVVDERGPLLKAGMFARVTLPVGEPKTLPLIPKDAVVIGGRAPAVYVVDTTGGKSTVRPVPVTLGSANGQWISVGASEIKAGDVVVVEGNERLRPGQEVRPETREISYP